MLGIHFAGAGALPKPQQVWAGYDPNKGDLKLLGRVPIIARSGIVNLGWFVLGICLFFCNAEAFGMDFKTEAFNLTFASDGRPYSLIYLPDNQELIDRSDPGSGFEVYGFNDNQREPLTKAKQAGEGSVVFENDLGTIAITVSVLERKEHLAFKIESVRGISQAARLKLRFNIRLKITGSLHNSAELLLGERLGASLMAADYMTYTRMSQSRDGVLFTAYWPYFFLRGRGDNPSGGFALFVSSAEKAFEIIGEVEKAEGLPHPVLEGKWAKINNWPAKQSQYTPLFGPNEIEDVLDYAGKTGLHMIYLPCGRWQSSDYSAKREFWPEGNKSLREFSDRLLQKGVLLGLHCGSMGIDLGDSLYGGRNLSDQTAAWGGASLTRDVAKDATEIRLRLDPGVELPTITHRVGFEDLALPTVNHIWNHDWIQIGGELVKAEQWEPLKDNEWRLTGCIRGVHDTTKSAHASGDRVKCLISVYKQAVTIDVYSPLYKERARMCGNLMNECRAARISFDALEMSDYAGRWTLRYWMQLVFESVDHYFFACSSSGLPQYEWHVSGISHAGEVMHYYPKGYFDSYLMSVINTGRDNFVPSGMGSYPLMAAHNSWYATAPDDMEWWLGKSAAYDALYYLEGSIDDWKKNGQTEEILEKVRNWEKLRLSGLLTPPQREKLKEYFTSFRLTTNLGDWSVTPVSRSWHYPHADGKSVVVLNKYDQQHLRFELEPLGRMKYNDSNNIPVLPTNLNELEIPTYLHVKSADGTFDSKTNYRYQPPKGAGKHNKPPVLAELMEIMGVGATGKRIGEDGKSIPETIVNKLAPALTLTATNYESTPSWQTFMTYKFPEAYNFSGNRGLGVHVTGDGKGEYLFFILKSDVFYRCYFIKIDFTGRRLIEIPSYRCMLEGAMDDLYRGIWKQAALNPWFAIKKGFDFTRVDEIYVGFMGIEPGETVTCAIESPQMLREFPESLCDPVVETALGRLCVKGRVESGEFLCYEGGGEAVVRDLNRNVLRTLKVDGAEALLPAGQSQVSVGASSGGDQWVRLQMKCVDKPFKVANPSESDKELLKKIFNYYK
jgi:hypothetical protein